jgi:hypothetical protein
MLMGRALTHLEGRGFPAAQNRPYSGGYVLDRHGAPQAGVHALQVEVCRATYLDRQLAEPGAGLPAMAAALAALVRELGSETALLGGSDAFGRPLNKDTAHAKRAGGACRPARSVIVLAGTAAPAQKIS